MENNKGKWCRFQDILCQEGYCFECLIFRDKLREVIKFLIELGKANANRMVYRQTDPK